MGNDGDQNIEQKLDLRSNDLGFTPAELIECTRCSRANAPDRGTCLYCGAEFEGVGITKFDIREPEGWENGFNVVVVDSADADLDRASSVLGSLLREERERLKAILTCGKAIPLARVESAEQASGLAEKLLEFGVKTKIVTDTALQPAVPPTRLRSVMFDGNDVRLVLFSSGETITLRPEELALIIPGMIIERRTESIERRKLRGSKTLSETELSSHEPVIDIYSNEPSGWRVPATGFDFSSLGRDKSLIVSENMKRLASKLAEFSPSARVVDDYINLRSELEHVWPSESSRHSEMLGIKGKDRSKKLTTNNSSQFTKYSRLQWQLYEKKV